MTELEGGGEILWKCVKKCNFLLKGWTQWNLTPHSNFMFQTPPSDQLRTGKEEKERDSRSPDMSVAFHIHRGMLAGPHNVVSAPDKSLQFINEIDGIAYRQLLHSVFSHSSSQGHQCRLISSLPESRLAQVF